MITSSPTFGRDLDDLDQVEPDPLRLLAMWLPDNTAELRPLMTLATLDADGHPDSRNVLVSRVDQLGLHFHTDATSRKAIQLAEHPYASAALAWPDVGRQLVVRGPVEREPTRDATATFAARSRYLQLLAWANTAATAQLSAPERRASWAEFAQANPDGSLTAPDTWVGFVLRPARLTFWRGDPDGPSNRVEYRRTDGDWQIATLPG